MKRFGKTIIAVLLAIAIAATGIPAFFFCTSTTVYADGIKGVIKGLKQVEATEDSVTVTWIPVEDVAYQLIYSDDKNNMPNFPSSEWTNPADPDNPRWTITGLQLGKTYYVQMRTVDIEIVHGYFQFTYGDPSRIIAVRPKKAIEPEITLSCDTYIYNGNERKPGVKVTFDGKVLDSSNYKVTYAKGCKNVGTYQVKVTMKGSYEGSAVTSFQIIPKGTSISNFTRVKKGFAVSWKKQSQQTSGYEIEYSLDKNFDSKKAIYVKKKVISNPGTTKTSIKNLKSGKKYFVRIRTYKIINNKYYYSKWSKVSSVVTK